VIRLKNTTTSNNGVLISRWGQHQNLPKWSNHFKKNLRGNRFNPCDNHET
jgi:hypothetical protein